jgi:hypothetical protein
MHKQRSVGRARVTATFFNTYSPACGGSSCAPRVIFCSYRLSTARAKGRRRVGGVVFKASAALFRCPGGRNTGIQET